MTPDPINSPSNPRIKDLVRLRERRHRDRSGTFLIEGYRELLRAIGSGLSIDALYVCPDLFLGPNERELIHAAAAGGATVVEVAEAPFRKASYRDRPDGLLGVAPQFDVSLDRIDLGEDPLLLVLESIEKPGNLGTMLRTADAAGCTGVIVCDPATDPFNPNVVRASTGMLFVVPLAIDDTAHAIGWLRERSIRIVASAPEVSLVHSDADLTGPIAIAVGAEQYGLSESWLDGADARVRIPMAGQADSLNAAMAAGILLFEAVRQRNG